MADEMNKEREAFNAYLKDCGEKAIVPDVGGAWHAAFQAGRASLAASAGSEPVAPYSIDADTLGIRSTVAEAITGALAFGAQGVNQPPEGHWLAPFWKAAREDKEAVRVKRDLRNELQQQCSTWGTYWRGSDAHGVVLSHPQAVELLQNALGVEVEIEIRGCQTCDYTGVIGDVPCPDCTHPSPPEGAGWISVDERLPELYKRVLVITTDCDDDPYATPAHYNGPGKFLAAGGHRLEPVTHWQEIESPPVGWKLPPAKPRIKHRRKPAPPASEAKGA